MRIRPIDEYGLPQIFDIKESIYHSHQGSREMPGGASVTNDTLIYECRISVNKRDRIIMLYYNLRDDGWTITD